MLETGYIPEKLALDLAVQGMATKKPVIFLLLNAVGLLALVARTHVAGNGFTLFAGFSTFQDDVLSCHGFYKFNCFRKTAKNTAYLA